MPENKEDIKNVIAVCNEFMDTKILFIDRKIQKLLEEIVKCSDVYNLISDCLNVFNRDKEYDRAFSISSSGKGIFTLPKEEVKVIALVFCILGDINSRLISLDELVGKFFLDEEGKKDYSLFIKKVIIPFRDLISEAFNVSTNVTTIESIEDMENEEEQEEEKEDEGESPLGTARFSYEDSEDLDRIFELSKDIASQIYELLIYERKQNEEVCDAQYIVNSIVIACNKKDFEQLYSLTMGLKYIARSIKDTRFLVRELTDLIKTHVFTN